MPFKDKDKNRKYQREWARKKSRGLPTRSKRNMLSDEERKTRDRQSWHKYQDKLHALRDKTWGIQCAICHIRKAVHLHKKDGTKHGYCLSELKKALAHPEQWIRLCHWCHIGVHFCMNYLNWNWDTIEKNVIHRTPNLPIASSNLAASAKIVVG